MPETPALALGDIDRCHAGVTARELLDKRKNRQWLSARELQRWLVDNEFAVTNGTPHTLVPTPKAIGLAGSLDFIRG